MLQVLIYNIFAMFGLFIDMQFTVLFILAVLLFASFIDFFLYSHKADFIQGLLKKNKKKLPDPLISRSALQMISFLLNTYIIGDFVVSIYIVELEIKDTTDRAIVM